MWNRRMEFHIFAPIGEMARHTIPFFADKIEQVPAFAETQRRLFAKNWAWLDRELADGRPFIAGEGFTVADITGMAALFVCDITQTPLPKGAELVQDRWVREDAGTREFRAAPPGRMRAIALA